MGKKYGEVVTNKNCRNGFPHYCPNCDNSIDVNGLIEECLAREQQLTLKDAMFREQLARAEQAEELLKEEVKTHDGGSPYVNYCWWCEQDVNGKNGPKQSHTESCWYVRAMAVLGRR